MISYKWLENETGKALLVFLEEMKGFVRDLPPIGSLAVGIGKAIGDTIEMKARELEIPLDEAVNYFFSEVHSRNRRLT
jgi:hypothetical protein